MHAQIKNIKKLTIIFIKQIRSATKVFAIKTKIKLKTNNSTTCVIVGIRNDSDLG